MEVSVQDSYLQFHGHLAGSAVFHAGIIEKKVVVCVLVCYSGYSGVFL